MSTKNHNRNLWKKNTSLSFMYTWKIYITKKAQTFDKLTHGNHQSLLPVVTIPHLGAGKMCRIFTRIVPKVYLECWGFQAKWQCQLKRNRLGGGGGAAVVLPTSWFRRMGLIAGICWMKYQSSRYSTGMGQYGYMYI